MKLSIEVVKTSDDPSHLTIGKDLSTADSYFYESSDTNAHSISISNIDKHRLILRDEGKIIMYLPDRSDLDFEKICFMIKMAHLTRSDIASEKCPGLSKMVDDLIAYYVLCEGGEDLNEQA